MDNSNTLLLLHHNINFHHVTSDQFYSTHLTVITLFRVFYRNKKPNSLQNTGGSVLGASLRRGMVGHLSSHPAGVLAGVVEGSYWRSRQSVGQAEECSAGNRRWGQTEEVVGNLHWGLEGPSHHLCRQRIHPRSRPSGALAVRLSPPGEKCKVKASYSRELCSPYSDLATADDEVVKRSIGSLLCSPSGCELNKRTT